MTRVAILWHMHQPYYEDLVTREHILPWVRLHALKDYYGMVAILREFPDVRMTFNLVPSLLVQLEAFAGDRARDRSLELSLKPAADLDEHDIEFVVEHFFHAQRQRMIDIYPRYAELLARRGGSLPTPADRRAAAARFNRNDLRDLQVWHKLAWIDPLYLDSDPRVRRLVGLWPSEGSVSDAMIPLAAAAGFKWLATDELILARTLNATFSRDGRGHVEQPEWLYTPYRIRAGSVSVTAAFRDHVLSDLIGFTYAGWNADAAADDFVGRLVEAGRRYRERTGGGEALIPIIFDGENAWEHFEAGGRPFLRALYRRLSSHGELRTVTMAEACAAPVREITSIFPGSWIDANFYIWIGHADDQRGWSQLAEARATLETVPPGS